jgi:hypothetical protein
MKCLINFSAVYTYSRKTALRVMMTDEARHFVTKVFSIYIQLLISVQKSPENVNSFYREKCLPQVSKR